MIQLWQWITQHPIQVLAVENFLLWTANAAIGSLPMPDEKSGKFYDFFFKFSNTFAANVFRVKASIGKAGPQTPPTP